jgi:hypothetical protein
MLFNFKFDIWDRKTKERIFFLHIPKCGGTSIDFAIENSIQFENKDKQHFNLDFKASHETSNALRKPAFRRDLLYYLMSSQQYRYISGHFAFSSEAINQFNQEWKSVTLLREPVSRWISNYFFNRYKSGDHFKIEYSLDEHLKTKRAIRSGQTYLNLLANESIKDGSGLENYIQQAVENLEKFSVIGILEDLDSLRQDFKECFGAQLRIPKRNTNPLNKSHQKEIISSEMKEKICEICQPDIIIYEAAKKMIHAKRQ